jgi:hypothetical protein
MIFPLILPDSADLAADSGFWSKNEPGQWVSWYFHEMRVRLTRYTIKAGGLKSWVIDGSLTGWRWMEIDRQTNNEDFKKGYNTPSFTVPAWPDFRFIRLTQTGERHVGGNFLSL